MRALVQFSGGIGSWAAAKRCIEIFGEGNVELLFADTIIEDDDLYRFLVQAAADVLGVPLSKVQPLADMALVLPPAMPVTMQDRKDVLSTLRADASLLLPGFHWIAEGRTPWEVFRDERYIGNSRVDPCSKILKRQLCDRWRASHTTPETTTACIGIDWTEEHRFVAARDRFLPWTLIAPLCDPPYLAKHQLFDALDEAGIVRPRLYGMGFPHNNCGGFCIKAGQAHFANLHRVMPERYALHEAEEESMRSFLGKDVSILKDRKGGTPKQLTLRQFRERLEAQAEYDKHEWGGCGCFTPSHAGQTGGGEQ